MIFASDTKLSIGQIIIPYEMYGAQAQRIEPQPIRVIRECTYREYRENAIKENLLHYHKDPNFPYYYEILTD